MTIDTSLLLPAASQALAGQTFPLSALYLVSTPIGNLADITLRALHVLQLVDYIACEDTRVSARFLQHIGLHKKLLSLHEHNEAAMTHSLLNLLQQGMRIAYMSDAGTPAISDPGAGLVKGVRQAGYAVIPVPGVSSVTTALSVAGDTDMMTQGFYFGGFLPAKGAQRVAALQAALQRTETVVLLESPHRILDLAALLAQFAPDRLLTLCRELTKQFETVHTLAAQEGPAWLAADANRVRGEFVVVLHSVPATIDNTKLPAATLELLAQLLKQQMPVKQAVGLLTQVTTASRNALYENALKIQQNQKDAAF